MLTLNLTLFQPWVEYVIPLAGWGTAFGMMLITGEFAKGMSSLCLLLAANGVCIYYIIRCNADYYEDVLGVTEQVFTKAQAAKEGRVVNQKKKPMKLKETGIGKGWGANAIYQRHRLEQRRKGKGLLDMKTLGLTALVGFRGVSFKRFRHGIVFGVSFLYLFIIFYQCRGTFQYGAFEALYLFDTGAAISQASIWNRNGYSKKRHRWCSRFWNWDIAHRGLSI